MNIETTVLELEQAFWKGDADFYRANLTDDALLVLPGIGILDKSDTAKSIAEAPRWVRVQVSGARVVEIAPGSR